MTKGDNQPKNGRSNNRGIAVVVLDALTRVDLNVEATASVEDEEEDDVNWEEG